MISACTGISIQHVFPGRVLTSLQGNIKHGLEKAEIWITLGLRLFKSSFANRELKKPLLSQMFALVFPKHILILEEQKSADVGTGQLESVLLIGLLQTFAGVLLV